MPLAGVLVQYIGWSSVFYVYGEVCIPDVCQSPERQCANTNKQKSQAEEPSADVCSVRHASVSKLIPEEKSNPLLCITSVQLELLCSQCRNRNTMWKSRNFLLGRSIAGQRSQTIVFVVG